MFTDRVRLSFCAGKGGNGVVAWHRAKYIPKGGPSGGNGGRGGSIFFEANTQLFSLEDYRHKRLLKAESGRDGGSNLRQGKSGKDLVVQVPCGTLIKDAETGTLLYDLTEDKERFLLCQGGRGGLGNNHFKTSTRRAPNFCIPGKSGEEKEIELELKLLADIGLVGFPNAGKSSLFSRLTTGRAKVGAYPFTTMHPNIGFLADESGNRRYMADIPGIIADAHRNRGLGLDFLRHIERTSTLIFVLDAAGVDGRDPIEDYHILRQEMAAYDPHLLQRPYSIVLNKMDIDTATKNITLFQKTFPEEKERLFLLSAETKEGIDKLRNTLLP